MGEPRAQQTIVSEQNGKTYRWERFASSDTGILAIRLTDLGTQTALTVTPEETTRRAAHQAWAGARQSRAPGTTIEILAEMGVRGIDPDAKLEETFRNYGHASVADMARLSVHFHNVPGHLPLLLFHLGRTNSGQEKSTRYQHAFGNAALHPLRQYLTGVSEQTAEILERDYQDIGVTMQERFNTMRTSVIDAFTRQYQPKDKQEETSLKSRALDTARSLLLLGAGTGCTYETSAREWGNRIASLRAMPSAYHRSVADQLEYLLAPPESIEQELRFKAEAPSLIKHTEPDTTVVRNLAALATHVHGRISCATQENTTIREQGVLPFLRANPARLAIAQHITAALPSVDARDALAYVENCDARELAAMSAIIYAEHTHHREPSQLADTTGIGAILHTSLGEARDFNRHRAFARYIDGWSFLYGAPCTYAQAIELFDDGAILPLYLKLPEFNTQRQQMIEDLEIHYARVKGFISKAYDVLGDVDYSWCTNLLPMAHKVDLWMHGTPHQLHYLTHLRVREGGHINYRALAYELNQRIADGDPAIEGIRLRSTRPDPANREEFFSRR